MLVDSCHHWWLDITFLNYTYRNQRNDKYRFLETKLHFTWFNGQKIMLYTGKLAGPLHMWCLLPGIFSDSPRPHIQWGNSSSSMYQFSAQMPFHPESCPRPCRPGQVLCYLLFITFECVLVDLFPTDLLMKVCLFIWLVYLFYYFVWCLAYSNCSITVLWMYVYMCVYVCMYICMYIRMYGFAINHESGILSSNSNPASNLGRIFLWPWKDSVCLVDLHFFISKVIIWN